MQENDQKVNEAIGFFETMLESMPGDRTSLEFLVVAYEQTGDLEKRRKCLISLIDTLINEKAFSDAQSIAAQLKAFPGDSEALEAVERLNAAVAKRDSEQNPSRRGFDSGSLEMGVDGSLNVPDPGIEVHAYSRAALSAEMDLVWRLKDKKILPLDICEELINALSEFPVSERPQLISALSFLNDRHPEWTDRVMYELQKISKMPAIPLELFSTNDILPSGITTAYMIIRGLVPFARMADEYLIGIMNPLDKALQSDVRSRLGTGCHFFLCHPGTCQQVLESRFEIDS